MTTPAQLRALDDVDAKLRRVQEAQQNLNRLRDFLQEQRQKLVNDLPAPGVSDTEFEQQINNVQKLTKDWGSR